MSELEIAKYEASRNEAMDDYFSARPQLLRTSHEELIFEAGFERAYKQLQATNQQLLEALLYVHGNLGRVSEAEIKQCCRKAISNANQPANHTQQAQSGNTNDCEWYARASESPVSPDQLIGSPKKK